MFADGDKPIWTVSKLTGAIKDQLQETFPLLRVEGEISNCRPSGAGHIYFTLKDPGAVISAALFRSQAGRIRVKPVDGMNVIATGRIDVYLPKGTYQLIVEDIRAAGRGALLEALEERRHRLESEGLFDRNKRQPLPPYPRRIAVVTSPTGAAVRDILQVLSRREAAPQVTILPTLVQGTGAPQMIADQLTRAERYRLGEVIILARGGGSLEDLMAFNEEIVVRSIAACSLPIICGVGHETDVSLADLAADIRAATPSTAAELVSDRSEDLLLRAKGFHREAENILSKRISDFYRRLERCNRNEMIALARKRLDPAIRQSDEACQELCTGAESRLGGLRKRLELTMRIISAISPQAVLARGYSRVTRNGIGIASAKMLNCGDEIEIRFADDEALAEVKTVI